MPNGPKPPPNSPPTPHISSATAPSPPPPCSPHVWILEAPEKAYTVDQKKARLRSAGDIGSIAEADGADHNKVANGDDMSGANKASKLNQVCSVCGAQGGDVDHVNRDSSGKITEVVEVKGGKCNVDKVQILRRKELADSMGAKVRVKLKGPGADLGKKAIDESPDLADIAVTVL
jgi:hypothetical protein